MCGIFGLITDKGSACLDGKKESVVRTLIDSAQTRGRDSSGIIIYDENHNEYTVFKGSLPIKSLAASQQYRNSVRESLNRSRIGSSPFFLMGHSRLATNGSQRSQENNQPVVIDNIMAIHNGIIVNDEELWSRHSHLTRSYEVDTEIFLALLSHSLKSGADLHSALEEVNTQIEGTASMAIALPEMKMLLLHSNNGSLYVLSNLKDVLVFASERHPLKMIADKYGLTPGNGFEVWHLNSGTYCFCNYEDMKISIFDDVSKTVARTTTPGIVAPSPKITTTVIDNGLEDTDLVPDVALIALKGEAAVLASLLEFDIDAAQSAKRCTKCLLPSTFPFIEFDAKGVCNYCRNYKIKNNPGNLDELMNLIEPYRSSDGSPDCIVPFSGGRDSTCALHIIKTRLGLNPIAFTYDWGMVTDLGRRNIARVCGKLRVENIIVAADIRKKRENIRKNLSAWLQRPHLGMIPLLMAGDKYFYYYVEKIKKETGIKLNLWGVNPMENTDFKVGFLGVRPDFDKQYIYSLSSGRKIRLLSSIAGTLLNNPRYINSSLFDTMGSFVSRSLMPHRDYFHVFDYFRWDETEIDELITREYNWEKAIDTTTTWRIGDGTAAFYNYAYFTVAGFSEHDTFRSNQIREGVITREEGLKLIMRENIPRYATIKWYLDVIGMDYRDVISTVNKIPKLYEQTR